MSYSSSSRRTWWRADLATDEIWVSTHSWPAAFRCRPFLRDLKIYDAESPLKSRTRQLKPEAQFTSVLRQTPPDFQRVGRNLADVSDAAAIDKQRRRCVHIQRLPQGDRSVHMFLGYRSARAHCNVGALHASTIGQRGQLLIGVFGRNIALRFVGFGNELPERIIRCSPNTIRVSRAFGRPVMYSQGKVLKDETRVRAQPRSVPRSQVARPCMPDTVDRRTRQS